MTHMCGWRPRQCEKEKHLGTARNLNLINATSSSLSSNMPGQHVFLCDSLTYFAICSGESRCTVARVVIDSINAGGTVLARVVNTVVNVWEKVHRNSKNSWFNYFLKFELQVTVLCDLRTRFAICSGESCWAVTRLQLLDQRLACGHGGFLAAPLIF